MEIAEIKSKGYNSFKQQYELYALVKNPKAFSKYEYKKYVFLTEAEMNRIKVGDIID